MTGKRRPLTNISYAAIAQARKDARLRSKTVNIACPVCGPERKGDAAKRKVLRTWTLDNYGISVHCVRCGVEGWVAPDQVTNSGNLKRGPAVSDDNDERKKRRNAELAERIWRETCSIAGTAGESYLNRRGIEIAAVPDYGGLRWHPRCPWGGGRNDRLRHLPLHRHYDWRAGRHSSPTDQEGREAAHARTHGRLHHPIMAGRTGNAGTWSSAKASKPRPPPRCRSCIAAPCCNRHGPPAARATCATSPSCPASRR